MTGMVDYHLHTARCGHATGEMRRYVERALEVGLTEIGFADHLPMLNEPDPTLTMSAEELPVYLDEIESLRRDFPEIAIRSGIEADYLPGLEAETAKMLDACRFDYVIGSVHFLQGWGFDDPRCKSGYEGRRPLEVYESYFEALVEAAESRLFDIIAHPDLIKKYNYRPDGDVTHLYKRAAEAIAKAGAAVEINTSGLRKPVREIYPTLEFLVECRAAGVPLTFGSDAHVPGDVGRDFALAVELAKEAGYRKMALFKDRRMSLVDMV